MPKIKFEKISFKFVKCQKCGVKTAFTTIRGERIKGPIACAWCKTLLDRKKVRYLKIKRAKIEFRSLGIKEKNNAKD